MVFVLLGLLAVPGFVACDDGYRPRCNDCPPPPHRYSAALTHPDSLLQDLETCYERREIDRYAPLLAPEFKFILLEDDVTPEIPPGCGDFGPLECWDREGDSTATRALFESSDVGDIRIDLTRDPPQEVVLEGKTVQRVFVSFTELSMDLTNDVTLCVYGDSQYFYFRRGMAGDGEDPARWYILQWEDLGHVDPGVGAPAPADWLCQPTTWSSVKMAYR